MNVERSRRYKLVVIAVVAFTIITSASAAFLYLAKSQAPTRIGSNPLTSQLPTPAFQPSQLARAVGHNNTISFVDGATSPSLVKLTSYSPWQPHFGPS